MKFAVFLLIVVLNLIFCNFSLASDKQQVKQFITLVNPVRISDYNSHPKESLQPQYQEVKKRGLPATWLFTYDALSDRDVISASKEMDDLQEKGIFLEVTPSSAKETGISYQPTDSWHRAKSLFLIGYTQDERVHFIDAVFDKFKSVYGYYPTSVGAWWVDAYSLEYMKNKYRITANLSCADQFFTDSYSLWGQYWSTPFYPSKLHAGIPANIQDNKLDLVTLQWAARDPINGYGFGHASTFSTQDYHTNNLPISYYEKLINIYLDDSLNSFGQITLGLESDLSPSTYKSLYAEHLDAVNRFANMGVQVTTMKAFSDWYRQSFPNFSPVQVITSDDLLGKNSQIIWYQSPFYRVGVYEDKENQKVQIIDLRFFSDNFQEPFYTYPTRQMDLFINTPSLIDMVSNKDSILNIPFSRIISIDKKNNDLLVTFVGGEEMVLSPQGLSFINVPQDWQVTLSNKLVEVEKTANNINIKFVSHWPVEPKGIVVNSYAPQVLYLSDFQNLIKPQNRSKILLGGSGFFIIAAFLIIIIYRKRTVRKWFIFIVCSALLLLVTYKSHDYYIGQGEIDALYHLQSLPQGKVLVYDHYCLKCVGKDFYQSAAFVNQRDYVGKISNKNVIYNAVFFEALSFEESKQVLKILGADYIYLVKLGSYIETLPFPPLDYGLEKIYENAEAQIWHIKK